MFSTKCVLQQNISHSIILINYPTLQIYDESTYILN
jgi:hypothetical protein